MVLLPVCNIFPGIFSTKGKRNLIMDFLLQVRIRRRILD